jgi:hypothetical protein
MKYLVVHGSTKDESGGVRFECDSLIEAQQYVKQFDPEFVLVNDDADNRNGYRCRYLWGGYREGIEMFILERA